MGKYKRELKKIRRKFTCKNPNDPDLCFDIGAGESFTGTIVIRCSPDIREGVKQGTVIALSEFDSLLRTRVKKWNGVEPRNPSTIWDMILNMKQRDKFHINTNLA